MLTLEEMGTLTGQTAKSAAGEIGLSSLSRSAGGRLCIPREAVRELLASRGCEYLPQTVAFVSLKGGVGKTTAAVTTAVRAAQYGFNTCLLDLDPQASATLTFDQVPDSEAPLFCDLWSNPGEFVEPALVPIEPGLCLIPSALENALLDTALADPRVQVNAVQGVVDTLCNLGLDLVVIDCPPSLGTATVSAVCAANTVVIPLACDPYSQHAVALTLQEIEAIRHNFGLALPRQQLLVSRFDRRERIAREIFESLANDYPEILVGNPIPVSTEFNKALAERQTIFAHNRGSLAKREYDRFVRALLGLQVS
jgi:chromosome partitioning protein